MSIENVPKIRTVTIKNDSSGSTGDNIGSAIPPIVDLIPGFIISKVIKIMTINIIIIEPPGGCGGGGALPFAMVSGISQRA
tara:strand:+ start:948 stop:1190 length:243 start_codon:yes stop_codon:yes gene_type:complete